jgi:transcriptional regulator with XRE-family HTH domain
MTASRAPETHQMDVNAVVSYNLRVIRERRGMTQQGVADRLAQLTGHRLPQASISAMERGFDGERRRRFDAHELYLLSVVFGVPVIYFFLPPPGEARHLADTGRPIHDLYAAVFGREHQVIDLDDRLAGLDPQPRRRRRRRAERQHEPNPKHLARGLPQVARPAAARDHPNLRWPRRGRPRARGLLRPGPPRWHPQLRHERRGGPLMDRPDQDRAAAPNIQRPVGGAPANDDLAERFEDALRVIAAAADGPEDFRQGIAYMTERLAARRPAIADRWQAFVTHKRAAASAELLSLVDNSGVYPTSGIGRANETVRHSTEALRPAPATTPGIDVRDPRRGGNPPPQASRSAQAPAEPARPYLRATGPEIHTVPLADSDAARLELPGGEIYLHKRHQAPGGPVPPGWVAEHFGRWQGREAEVVYNPRRHDVIVTNRVHLVGDQATSLEAIGFERHATAGRRELWVRDRTAATWTALARHDQAAAKGIERGGPDHQLGPIDGPALAR